MFTKYMTYDPHVVMHGMEREYSKFFTGMHAHTIQVNTYIVEMSSMLIC